MIADLALYLVTDSKIAARAGHGIVEVVCAATRNGVTAVQVREKNASAREFLDTVLRIAEVIPEGVSLIVNDRVDVFLAARAAGASVAGVHVGQSDLPPAVVRDLIGPDALLGLSASTVGQLATAREVGRVDYVGIGALNPTVTKDDAPAPLGHTAFARLVAATELPVVAIGGVTRRDISVLRVAGVAGAAVVSAICAAADPAGAARDLRAEWDAARKADP